MIKITLPATELLTIVETLSVTAGDGKRIDLDYINFKYNAESRTFRARSTNAVCALETYFPSFETDAKSTFDFSVEKKALLNAVKILMYSKNMDITFAIDEENHKTTLKNNYEQAVTLDISERKYPMPENVFSANTSNSTVRVTFSKEMLEWIAKSMSKSKTGFVTLNVRTDYGDTLMRPVVCKFLNEKLADPTFLATPCRAR